MTQRTSDRVDVAVFRLVGEHRGDAIDHVLASDMTTIGRGSSSDLTLSSQTVSRNHAEVRREHGRVMVVDLGSLNGTRINGEAVHEPREARIGDVIEFGSVVLRLMDESGRQSALLYTDDDSVGHQMQLTRAEAGTSASALVRRAEPGLLDLLSEAGKLMVVPGSPEEMFDKLLDLVTKRVPANRIIILMNDAERDEPIQRAARVRGDRAIAPLMISRTMVRMVGREGMSFLTRDAQSDERFRHQESILAQNLHSAMAAPLVHNEETLGVLYVDTDDPLTAYDEQDLRVFTVLGQMLGAKIANANLLEMQREQQRLRGELETAARIQRRLLPQKLIEIPGYSLVGSLETSDAVGGDLYDAGELPDGRYQLLLGDVSGKGIGAALLMCDVLATIRALRGVGLTVDEMVRRLDRQLLLSTEPEHYVTLFVAELDVATHELKFVNGGHPAAIVIPPTGPLQMLDSTGPPPGLVHLPGIEFTCGSVTLPPGATLVVYSDGVSEAERGEDGAEMFGDERLFAVLEDCRGYEPSACAERIFEAVQEFLGSKPAGDDTTLLVVRRNA
jgi:serine phosphatase RsbU (regulator of sigma subunit)